MSRSAEQRLLGLFRGLERAYGAVTSTGERDARGKVAARYVTRREPVTEAAWTAHLAGEHCLVPIPIRDDGTAGFGAIDVDRYPLDLEALARDVERLGLPLVACRSKSGGGHLFLFLTEPYDAEVVQDRLMSWAVALGYPGVEVFPKQVSLAGEVDVGNGIAAPYRGGEGSLEYALAPDGSRLSLAEFLDAAEAARVAGLDLPEAEVAVDELLVEAPPCLQHWARVGVPEGQRNDTMFDFAVYAKRAWPDDWRDRFEELNRRFCQPPLKSDEVLTVIKSVAKKSYTYRSKCEGPYCQPQLCRKRQHGRGGGYDDPGVVIDSLTIWKTDPPTFIVSVNGHRIELDTAHITDQRRFRNKVIETLLTVRPRMVKPNVWEDLWKKLQASAVVEPAPDDAGARGQLRLALHEFFEERGRYDRTELRVGRAWHDAERQRTYFRSRDFLDHLRKQRMAYGVSPRDIYSLVRGLGGGDAQVRVGDGPVRCWWVPTPPELAEEPAPAGADQVPF